MKLLFLIQRLLVLGCNSQDQGFALWRAIVILLGLGGLGLITLPFVLGVGRGCGPTPASEARNHLRSMNRAQQAYYLENRQFSHSVADLGLGIHAQTTKKYLLATKSTGNAALSYAIADRPNPPAKTYNKSYIGAVFSTSQKKDGEVVTVGILCQSDSPDMIHLPAPTYKQGVIACGKGMTKMGEY
ncbi:MAG: type IV pilin-like G/H family protein [Trichocoleus desertorum ATA4-8-CV12]|jgi:hypothetical protein|nr:type IV pilin-like G/H family protein [Trichocoleus desertorum ATA4-8-CV12]